MRTRFHPLRKSGNRPASVSRPVTFRPALEGLEDRCLMASGFVQTNLVSDIPGLAPTTDPNLVNPWGLAASSGSPWWVGDNGTGLSTLYNSAGAIQSLVVTVPAPSSDPTATSAPTGTVFNGDRAHYMVTANGKTGSAAFLFATEDGTISGWSPAVDGTHAILGADNSDNGAVYKGLALGTDAKGDALIYATNFRSGHIDVFNDSFQPRSVAGHFTDADLPKGYAPFDVANIGGKLYVTYAKQNAEKHDDVAGAGHGFIDVFDTDGHLLQRLVSRGKLDSPWGLALAPANFGAFSGDLLVGNFGNGKINAYNPTTGQFVGTMKDLLTGRDIVIPGLWALEFGNGGNAGPKNALFFTAGIFDEQHGLFGELQAVTVPGKAAAASDDGLRQLARFLIQDAASGASSVGSEKGTGLGTSAPTSGSSSNGDLTTGNGKESAGLASTTGQENAKGQLRSLESQLHDVLDRLFGQDLTF